MARRSQLHRMDLVSHLNVNDPMIQRQVIELQRRFIAEGEPPNTALRTAWQALDGKVSAQAGILSYMDVFLYLGVLFLICTPLILFVREQKGQAAAGAAGMH